MKKISKKYALVLCYSLLSWSSLLHAENGFVVKNIKVLGLQRVSVGTVLNYLPVQIGEEIEPDATAEIIKTLYDTGFFQSITLEKEGNTLIVKVIERPTIGSINVVGNSEIPSEKLKEYLKELNLVQGRVFQRSSLEFLEKELKQGYTARGKYNARIDSKITELTENRVAITVTISEGRVSRIKEIRFIGNHDFSNSELLSQLSLSSRGLFTYFTKKDQYSKPALDASLEAIRSFYLDRGYLKFRIISSQASLSPDKKDVYINIYIEEGPQYHFSGYEVIGRTILPKDKINALVQVKAGQVFSRKKVTESISAMGLALGDKGYGFPAINAEPKVDENNKTVFITFVVDPGRHVYVRRINFHGNTMTGDYVLRNAIRQQEGSILSLHNIKESERQLRVLGYLKNVNVKTTPVPGSNNQVDLDINVEEGPSAEASASIGYGSNGPQFNAAFKQRNFMGTGRAVGLNFNASYWGESYNFHYYNPFYRQGIGRGVNLYFDKFDPDHLDVSAYSADRFGGSVDYNLELNEYSGLQFGYGYQNIDIRSVGWVQQIQNFVNLYGNEFNEIRLTGGWNRNTYDQMPYPNQGLNQQISLVLALPASSGSLSFYKSSYLIHWYQPIAAGFIFTTFGNVGYGNTFNNQGLPFFENYFAGGITYPGQVRGYSSYSLGPQGTTLKSLGGNFLINGSVGLILPYPLSRDNIRTTLFMDAGNVYARGTPAALTAPDAGPIRYSAGVSFEWRSPFGPLAFSLAKPLNLQPTDEQQIFQFTLSSNF